MIVMEKRRKLAEIREKAQKVNESETFGEAEETRFNELMTEADTIQAWLDRNDKVERLPIKPDTSETREQADTPAAPAYHKRKTPDTANGIYCRFIRTGDVGAQSELNAAVQAEYRASNDTTLNITTAADGGDLVPTGHYRGIIERARPMDLTSQLGLRDIPGQGTTVNVPIDNEADPGLFVSTDESTAFDRDAPAVSKVAMTLVKYTKKVDLTYELLQDEDSRLLAFLESFVAKGYAATLNSLMITEVLADGTAGLTLDAAAAIGAAEVPELLYKLSAEYARGSSVAWLMERATEGYLRGLFGTSMFSFGSQVGPASGNGTGVQSSLWGIPLYSDSNMGSLAASGKSMLIGNFDYMGKRIDPTMTVLRDPYTRSSYGEIILNYYFRADFEVLQAAAFQYATHASA